MNTDTDKDGQLCATLKCNRTKVLTGVCMFAIMEGNQAIQGAAPRSDSTWPDSNSVFVLYTYGKAFAQTHQLLGKPRVACSLVSLEMIGEPW